MPCPARVLSSLLLALLPTTVAAQATLNKCIDAQGLVTYTNKPCVNASEVRKLAIDPAPPIEPAPDPAPLPRPAANRADTAPDPVSVQLETRKSTGQLTPRKAAAGVCDTLSEQLGRVLDKMDQARRKGYTQAQMDKWSEESRALERKKQQSACF